LIHPKNLDLLPDWIQVKVEPYNNLCECVTEIVVNKPVTYALAEELWHLYCKTDVSLRNADNPERREGWPMCSTLSCIFRMARGECISLLASASAVVTKGNYVLGTCLEESPSGKTFLHDLHLGGDKKTYAPIPGHPEMRHKTAGEVAAWLMPRTEDFLAKEGSLRYAMKRRRAKNYLTGC
jgi:hypothetical protein